MLALVSDGRSNAGIAQALWITEGTFEKHVRSILMKVRLPDSVEVHRRVLAVLLDALTRGDAMRQPPGYLQCARWCQLEGWLSAADVRDRRR